MIPAFRKIRTLQRELQNIQDAVATVFNAIRRKEILDGRLIKDISITSGTEKSIDHGLENTPRGWIVVKKDANAVIYSSTSSTPKTTLILNSSANVEISIWVF